VDTLCRALCEQLLYGHYTLDPENRHAIALFIEYGFARHKPAETVIDEPMAILAALHWVNTEFSLFKALHYDIHKHSRGKNGFEAYLAFYLRHVFTTTPALNEVFTFRDDFARRTDLAWRQEEFELVTVVDSNKPRGSVITPSPKVSVVTPSSGPSSSLGFSANSGQEVLEWISTNKRQSTFCFPPESFGPDLLFFIRSQQEPRRLLLVVLQAKKHHEVTKGVLIHGVRTTTPSWFWRSKEAKVCSFLQAVCICFD